MAEQARLAEMLSTRLCHDLTGPIGAISNGVEFLSEGDEEMQKQAVELISSSAQEAVNRLQFYRAAYGRVNSSGEACLSDAKKLVQKYLAGGKVSLDWPDNYTDASGISISRKMVRLIFNFVILASGTLIRGGVISVRITRENDEKIIHVYATAPHIKWEENFDRALKYLITVDDVDPKTVQPFLAAALAEELNAVLEINKSDEIFEIIARQNDSDGGL